MRCHVPTGTSKPTALASAMQDFAQQSFCRILCLSSAVHTGDASKPWSPEKRCETAAVVAMSAPVSSSSGCRHRCNHEQLRCELSRRSTRGGVGQMAKEGRRRRTNTLNTSISMETAYVRMAARIASCDIGPTVWDEVWSLGQVLLTAHGAHRK